MNQDRPNDPAGAGSPAPAVSSGGAPDVVPHEARVELDRIRRRFGELTVDRADDGMPSLRRLLDDLATRWPAEGGSEEQPLHDLGPAVAVDQLTAIVWDAYATDRGDGIPQLLTELRRALP